jgi:hypothetical protein
VREFSEHRHARAPFDFGGVVGHRRIVADGSRFVEDHSGNWHLPRADGFNRQQRVVDRAQSTAGDDEDRHLPKRRELGQRVIVRDRAQPAADALDDDDIGKAAPGFDAGEKLQFVHPALFASGRERGGERGEETLRADGVEKVSAVWESEGV